MLKKIKTGLRRVSLPVAEVFGFVLIWVNFHVSVSLPRMNIFFEENTSPFGFDINVFVTFLVVIFIIYWLYKGSVLDRYPLASMMIIAGASSNLIERLYFGAVKDYLDVVIATINMADIEIWLGLILLNAQVWFLEREDDEKLEGENREEKKNDFEKSDFKTFDDNPIFENVKLD